MSSRFGKYSGLALAFLAFGGAEWVGGNGYLAAFVAGLGTAGIAKDTTAPVLDFMETERQMLMLVSFLVFGSIMVPQALEHMTWRTAVYAILSLTLVRAIPISLSLMGLRLAFPTYLFLCWFGPRGLASILFSLLIVEEMNIAAHNEILSVVVATVGLSVFAHGISAHHGARTYGNWSRRTQAPER
jgi:NhaP-type Na+/H+ or K+/H+ antiporter